MVFRIYFLLFVFLIVFSASRRYGCVLGIFSVLQIWKFLAAFLRLPRSMSAFWCRSCVVTEVGPMCPPWRYRRVWRRSECRWKRGRCSYACPYPNTNMAGRIRGGENTCKAAGDCTTLSEMEFKLGLRLQILTWTGLGYMALGWCLA